MARIRMLVFNARKWSANGGDSPHANREFWEPATILNTYHEEDMELLATVEWDDGSITAGHFVHMMQELPRE